MLSELGAPRGRIAGLKAGANNSLGKPLLFQELQLRVEVLIRGGAAEPALPAGLEAWELAGRHLDPQRLRLGRP